MKFHQICCFEKLPLFLSHCGCSPAALGGLWFWSGELCHEMPGKMELNWEISPRKERRTSWNPPNSWATSLTEVNWSRTWHHRGWLPTVPRIIDNPLIFCPCQVGFVALHHGWSCEFILHQHNNPPVGMGMGENRSQHWAMGRRKFGLCLAQLGIVVYYFLDDFKTCICLRLSWISLALLSPTETQEKWELWCSLGLIIIYSSSLQTQEAGAGWGSVISHNWASCKNRTAEWGNLL